jgi:hypothetical protein
MTRIAGSRPRVKPGPLNPRSFRDLDASWEILAAVRQCAHATVSQPKLWGERGVETSSITVRITALMENG